MACLPALVQYLQVCQYILSHSPISNYTCRKFFTFVVTLNCVGLLLAALDKWHYARHYTGALVLGNLLMAILMRNELFGRVLYLIANTLFAKVSMCRDFQ